MANKYLDLAGLEHLWDKIEDEVSTAADNAKAEAIASAATDATTKANNALNSAKADTDNKLKSYLPLSGIATAATKLSNTTAIGSATQPVYFSADGVPVATTYTLGASVPSGAVFTDEKVKLTTVAPTSNTYYYPVIHSATTGTTSLGTNSGIKVQMVTGTTSVTGFNQLVLGNNTASGTAGNQYGQITLYSSGTNGHTIIPASGTSNANHTLPATTGTILNTGTTSFTQTLTSGTEVGKIKINGTTTTLYAPTNTDEKATQTITETTNADYRVLLSANANDTTETNTLRKSAKFIANPATGAFYAVGYNRIDITGFTVDIDTYTLSSGSPQIKRYIVKTNGGAANITNIPVAGYPFLLDVELIRWASTTDYVTRQTFVNNKDYSEYERYCISGTWGTWTKKAFTDEKVKATISNPTNTASYYIPFMSSAETSGVGVNNGIKYTSLEGTTSANGQGILVLGNSTATGTAGNKYGVVRIYGKNTYYTDITASDTLSANRTLTLPNGSGRLALASEITDEKVKISKTNPGNEVMYNISFAANTGTTGVGINDGLRYLTIEGTESTEGQGFLILGNEITKGTVGNKYGKLRMYGKGEYYSVVLPNESLTASNLLYLPASTGTLALNTVATTSANGLMSSTDKSKLDYTNVAFATCATAAGTAEKVVTISDNSNWKLTTGSIITVLYTYSNTASSVTLNVNNTGAKEIYYGTAKYTGNSTMMCGAANRCITYMYSGVCWVWISSGMDNNTTYSAATSNALGLVKVGSNITNTSGTISLTKANVTAALGYTPPTTNTTYSNFVKSGTGAAAGLVPAPSTTAGTTKYLREDGTWQVPPNTKVTQTPINSSNTGNYPLLLAPTGQTATATTTANFASTLYYTPSNHTIVSKDLPLNFSSATTDISAANVSINGTASQVQLTGAKGVVLTSGDEGSITLNGTTHIEGNLTANNFITGTKTITLSAASAFGQTSLTSTDLGFEPTANTTIVVSLRRSYSPAPAHFNVYAHFFKASSATAGMIYLLISNGASGQTNVPAGTYYVDYIVTNNT